MTQAQMAAEDKEVVTLMSAGVSLVCVEAKRITDAKEFMNERLERFMAKLPHSVTVGSMTVNPGVGTSNATICVLISKNPEGVR